MQDLRQLPSISLLIAIGLLTAGCYTTPPTPASPAEIAVPDVPRSRVLKLGSGNDTKATCALLDAELRDLRELEMQIADGQWRLVCHKPTLTRPLDTKNLVGATIECLTFLPLCGLLGVVAAVEYEVKSSSCTEPGEREAKNAAFALRLAEIDARKKALLVVAEQKNCPKSS